MEYTLFQDFARKIPRLAPPTQPAAQGTPSQAVHRNLATGPKIVASVLSTYGQSAV